MAGAEDHTILPSGPTVGAGGDCDASISQVNPVAGVANARRCYLVLSL